MALTQVSTGGIKDGQVHTADLADSQITAAKLHADALDHTYTLGADGSNHYTFTGEGLTGAVNDPTLYLTRGKTYRFVNGNSAGAHPFRIQTTVNGSAGTEYNTGVTNNGGAGGSTIIFEVPHAAPDVLYYQCTSHGSMGGILYVTGALADGSVTEAKILNNAVTTIKIANNAITNAKVASGAISSATIIDANVTTAKIADQAVTLDKLPHGTSSNDGKFLRANNGADPSFETINIPAGVGGATGVDFNDNVAARFGTDNDATIKHDGYSTLQISYSSSATDTNTQTPAGIRILNNSNTNSGLTGIYMASGGGQANVGIFARQRDTATSSGGEGCDMMFYTKRNGQSHMAPRARFTNYGHFLPADTNIYDLGESDKRWRNIYTNDLHLSNKGHTNDVDGSWGDWTIQEGESDLFLKNNRSGKMYKFNLTEVT